MKTIHMSHKEIPRAGLLKAALAGKITNREGAKALQLTPCLLKTSSGSCVAEISSRDQVQDGAPTIIAQGNR